MRDNMRFNRGTSEYMAIEVIEEFGEITDLVTATFDIYESGDIEQASPLVTESTNVIVDGLQVRCLIEPDDDWNLGYYNLYLNLTDLPSLESPRLGPIEFIVEA